MSLSLRTKTIAILIGALIGLAAVLSLATTITFALLKERLVDDAVRLAREQVGQLGDDVRRMIADAGALTPDDIRDLASMNEQFEIVMRHNHRIVSIVLIDENKNVVVQTGAGSGADVEVTRRSVDPTVTAPIIVGDRKIGDLRVMLSQSQVLRDIQSTSRAINWAILIFLVSMAVVLVVVFLLIWRMFLRHVDAVRRNDESERMAYVGTLAAGLAHEIRNPLNAMGIKLQVMEEDIADPRPESVGRVRDVSNTIRSQIEQLNATVGHFLAFALPRNRETMTFDLRELIREARDLLQPEVESRGAEWIEHAPEPVMLRGEPSAFHEVVVNIALNALSAMNDIEGQRIVSTTLSSCDGQARLEIADTGPGVAPDDMKRIFEVFYTTREEGSGFGLAIARRIVEDHGGRIEVSNRPEGGACFTITAPLADSTPSPDL